MAVSNDSISSILGTYGDSDWREAVKDLTYYYGVNGVCYSSGEIAKVLRETRPNLRFSVTSLGEHLRDLFYSGDLTYPDPITGLALPAVQVSRVTQGLYPTRTPAGQPVFVYGPGLTAAENHEFEVYVPEPNQDPTTYPDPVVPTTTAVFGLSGTDSATTTPVANPPSATPSTGATTPVTIYGVPSKGLSLRATVHKERRVCITRSAFEVFVHATKTPLRGGEPVYLRFDLDDNGDPLKAIITRDEVPGSKAVDLRYDRGYIRFGSPGKPFNPGDVFEVEVEGTEMIVDLSAPVNN